MIDDMTGAILGALVGLAIAAPICLLMGYLFGRYVLSKFYK